MLIDITLKITPKMVTDAQGNEKKTLTGHLGTHFDVMDKEFPLEYTKRIGICFDVSGAAAEPDRDIMIEDIDLSKIEKDMFVMFYSGFLKAEGYGGEKYFREHPQLAPDLIDALLDRGVSVIGVDFAGVRRGREHTPADQKCADRGTFVIENMDCLEKLPQNGERPFIVRTFPMNYQGMTGLPCRIVAEI